jgi:hypothetical protein
MTAKDHFLGAIAKRLKAIICFMPVRMQKLGSHWTDFHEILYLSTLRKSVQEIQASLKYDKHNGYLTCKPIYVYDRISLSSVQNEKCFRQKL